MAYILPHESPSSSIVEKMLAITRLPIIVLVILVVVVVFFVFACGRAGVFVGELVEDFFAGFGFFSGFVDCPLSGADF